MHRSSYCGINCEKCKAYIATITDDDNHKSEIAKEWSMLYKRSFSTDDIVCYGCKSAVLFSLCSLCGIKTCTQNHSIENCEDCEEFPCEMFNRFLNFQKDNDTGAVFT
jgi:hypothetical protein